MITGATSGIGLTTARLFRAHGARLAIMARDSQAVDAAAAELGPHAVAVTGDVARASDLTALMHAANDAYGGIDVVVAQPAGIGRFAPLEVVTEDDFDALCAIHLRGTFFTVLGRPAVPAPRRRGGPDQLRRRATGLPHHQRLQRRQGRRARARSYLRRRTGPARHPGQHREPWPHRHPHVHRRPRHPARAPRRGRPPATRPDPAAPPRPPRGNRHHHLVPCQRRRELLHRRRPHTRRRYP